jgi:hypothetical protein
MAVVVFAFASEIGPGFSPGMMNQHRWGFSPWAMLSFPEALLPVRKKAWPRG